MSCISPPPGPGLTRPSGPTNPGLGTCSACMWASRAGPKLNTPGEAPGTESCRMTFYTNPVFDTDFPDPMILRAPDGWYYGYATQTIVDGRTLNIQVARSPDLIHWARLGDALPVKPEWARHTQRFWGPHVIAADGRYYMYYSASPDEGEGLCLAVAVATAPGGPFGDSGVPLRCGPGFANIDPMAFDDPATGQRLLYWGSGFGPIYVQPLAPERVR